MVCVILLRFNEKGSKLKQNLYLIGCTRLCSNYTNNKVNEYILMTAKFFLTRLKLVFIIYFSY